MSGIIKILLIYNVLMFLNFNISYAVEDYSAEIIPLIKPDNRIINMGPCLIQDSIRANFILKNTGLKALFMEPLIPSFYLGAIPNDLSDNFRRFSRITDLPKIFPANNTDTMTIQFNSNDTIITKPGWHSALLGLSFLKNDARKDPPISKIDTFFLKVKKTTKYFDGFDDYINFDSVYVNPTNNKTMEWRGRNVYKYSIFIKNREFINISQPNSKNEFKFNENIIDLKVISDGIVNWTATYSPNDIGIDSLYMKVNFNPIPDSLDSINIMVLGTGVQQKLKIYSSNYDYSGDTILVGKVRADVKHAILFSLKNTGNIPINSFNEELIDELSGMTAKDFKLTIPFKDKKGYLYPDSSKAIFIEYNPKNLGAFLIKYVITTDLTERNIYGVPESQKYSILYLKGSVVSPKLAVSDKNIDFGNIMINKSDCPAARDTILRISNAGNENLIISMVDVKPPYPESNFNISASNFELAPNQDTTIVITFIGNSGTIGVFSADLRIVSNQNIPSDTTIISLKAKGISPLTGNLSISDNITAKPGTSIEVPILLKYDLIKPSVFANRFTTDFSYNQTMLKYQGVKTLGSASEGSANHGDNGEIVNKNYISIDLQMPPGSYFKSSDTVALLRFDTFLGDAISSELAFSKPKFGDKNCDEVFGLNIINGIFTTDSVCGIEFKAVPKPKSKYYIKVIQNLQSDNEVHYEISMPVKLVNALDLYDSFGNKIQNIFEAELAAGIYSSYLNTENLNSGVYYLLLKNKFYQAVQTVVIIR
jgi:hypothetical protein